MVTKRFSLYKGPEQFKLDLKMRLMVTKLCSQHSRDLLHIFAYTSGLLLPYLLTHREIDDGVNKTCRGLSECRHQSSMFSVSRGDSQ